ncbi:MAG: intradiol ring-cleavage dioxygenase [Cyanobacteria bacterium P01_H01_bin.121]
MSPQLRPNRRTFLRIGSPMLASCLLAACNRRFSRQEGSASRQAAQAQGLTPTPSCGDDELTPSQTAGPFYTANSPERSSLIEPGMAGTHLILTGQVLSTQCEAIANAKLDFWHTDNDGQYDNQSYTLRGHQFTDVEGRYWLETIVPGIYPGRTRHLHVRVKPPNQAGLTTQLYFPDEPLNQRDFLFQPELLMVMQAQSSGNSDQQAQFDCVLTSL